MNIILQNHKKSETFAEANLKVLELKPTKLL